MKLSSTGFEIFPRFVMFCVSFKHDFLLLGVLIMFVLNYSFLLLFLGVYEQSTGLLPLLPFLFPGVYQVNKNWKPTKSNVLDGFIFKADSEADVEDGIDKLRGHLEELQTKLKWKNTIHLQPFVLAV